MKILRLKVTKLYGVFDYDVVFNSDVTFIYGENGCGKTTILNITEAIITGQLYNLFEYNFKEIVLYYSHNGKKKDINEIKITLKKETLNIIFNEQVYKITSRGLDENLINNYYLSKKMISEFDGMEKFYFNRYSFLNEIKDTFNYVYLPLNRSSIYDNFNDYDFPRNIRDNISGYMESTRVKVEKGIRQVEELIASKYLSINGTIATINDEFRNNILKSLMEVSSENSIVNNVVNFKNDKNLQNEMNDIKKEYTKTLFELGLLANKEEDSINLFFDNYIKDLYLYNLSDEEYSIDLSLLFQYQEIIKIKKIINIAKESEKQKAKVRNPIETFLTTINGFIENGADNKKIAISKEGKIYFTTKYSNKKISIHYLSSGEKQLLIFFANLIFNVKSGKSGIFVVDEPEISLHLSWQREFVEKALEVNKNLQLIFATHAPEIIGKRRDKAFRLEKIFEEAGSPN